MKLLAALSGGVDSAVAAALAADEGHELTGVTLKQWDDPTESFRMRKGCSVVDAVADARRACDVLGIPHYTLNFVDLFTREVIEPFAADYAAGRTPNPCLRCNEIVRFGALLDRAKTLGFDGLVTGHYVRVASSGRLRRARDADRDQSYVLYTLSSDAIERLRFPLGEGASKGWVREEAARRGLLNAEREDSMDVCFVPEGRAVADLVGARHADALRAGPVVDQAGSAIGEHEGIARYTIGQRKGLPAVGRPQYVTRIDAAANTIVAGPREALEVTQLAGRDPRFAAGEPSDGAELEVVVRYRGRPQRVRYRTGFFLEFETPAEAVAPGQAAVLYDGDEVVGGALIERTESR